MVTAHRLRAGQLADRRPSAWRTYARSPPPARLARPGSAPATGERPAPRRARRRTGSARALSDAPLARTRERHRPRAIDARTPRRPVRDRARARLPVVERPARARRGADAR